MWLNEHERERAIVEHFKLCGISIQGLSERIVHYMNDISLEKYSDYFNQQIGLLRANKRV